MRIGKNITLIAALIIATVSRGGDIASASPLQADYFYHGHHYHYKYHGHYYNHHDHQNGHDRYY